MNANGNPSKVTNLLLPAFQNLSTFRLSFLTFANSPGAVLTELHKRGGMSDEVYAQVQQIHICQFLQNLSH